MSLSHGVNRLALRRGRDLPVPPALGDLGERLGAAFASEGIRYCRLTGAVFPDKWITGEGDLDLLVDRRSFPALSAVLFNFGFKLAIAPAASWQAGTLSFLGKGERGRLIHLHVHTRVLIGKPWLRSYDLPLAAAILDSAIPATPFPMASPEFAFLLLVFRMTLRHDLRDLVGGSSPPGLAKSAELAVLRAEASSEVATALLARWLPEVSPACFADCRNALSSGVPVWRRLATRRALERRLRRYAIPPSPSQRLAGVRRVVAAATGISALTRPPRKRLAAAGAVIALVGADGAGKSTCARALVEWLGTELSAFHGHLGKPPRSFLTFIAGGLLKAGRAVGSLVGRRSSGPILRLLQQLRSLATARDRLRLAARARLVAASGGVAICERFPVSECYSLAGPSRIPTHLTGAWDRVTRWLWSRESACYARIGAPDLILALSVDPELAVRRKPDEPEAYVRRRARLFQAVDWSRRRATLVDAGRSIDEVLATLRSRVWKAL